MTENIFFLITSIFCWLVFLVLYGKDFKKGINYIYNLYITKKRKKMMGGGRMMPDRVMLKSGGMCKLASKGKGRAYGKNS